MSADKDDVVRVAAGNMIAIELYKQELVEAGIEAKVVGEALGASFGSALPQSVELMVHRKDAERARDIIKRLEKDRAEQEKKSGDRQAFPHPSSEPNPHRSGGHGPHTHYNPDPH
jgi:hypothetical protein